ncbi:serine/threonine-protein kinase [Streptomyces sp. NPDC091377]|uniref:serine/threonine-protein kinase n=1 Tax=Streptomyces sp. NPDC091377 TaxID=3365995 RepID=UPI003810CAA5
MSETERTGASRQDNSARLLAGRYRLGDVLGRGGMGTVWRAQDETLGRTVAVKELRFPSSIDEEEKRRLITRTLREAKAIARIRNNSAVTVFDVVQEDDRPWIVMELVEGKSLAEVIREDGLLEPRRAAEVGLAILDVLRSAHREGILHRDVKPSNVLIAEDGRVVLTDFGIAQVEGDPSITSTGMLVGAPSYISPERARGHKPGPAADLWSLGGLLYAAVEGAPPYDKGSAIATLTAVMTEPLEEPKNAGPLAGVIRGLLDKDPAKRLDDTGARAGLTAVIHGPDTARGGSEPADATKVVPLPPQTDRRSGPGSPGGTKQGTKQGAKQGGEPAGERLRGALRSVRKAAGATGAAAGAATGTRKSGGGAEGATSDGSTKATKATKSAEAAKSPGAAGAAGSVRAGNSGGAGERAPGAAGGSAATGAGAGAVSATAGMPVAGARGSAGAGGSAGSTDAAGTAGSSGSGAGAGARGGASGGAGGGAPSGNGASAGRSSGWPVMPPPDLPTRSVPRASLTDVVPRRTLVIIAVVAVLAVLSIVLTIAFAGGGGSDAQSKKDDAKSSATTDGDTKKDDNSADPDGKPSGRATGESAPGAGGEEPGEDGSADDSPDDSGGDDSGKEDGGDDGAASTYKGGQGYSIGLPEGWKYRSSDAAGNRFTGPDGQKLLIAWTSTPKDDPVADWKNQERSMTRSQYDRIRIEAVDYRGWNTADWEFTYTESGTKYRTIDRGFVVSDDQGYALMYTAKAKGWDGDQRADTWRTFTQSFEPKS